ncbi:saccharopine dehydrogenase NADP-binding domain-containing protein [Saccharopolyspora sp. NPDC049426]|uniref:saccharopine dehydrogenase family protein n=1 Tax=Saccharopolyspora sp. NPDC049426 TaxID=3155652 RepID=UPI0034183A3A
MPDRTYDFVLFGATGFAGGLTADYLARHLPAGARWALAGRNPAKLRAARDRLAEAHPDGAHVELFEADATDADALREVAESTRVVITTVGPYLEHGEPLVAACAAAGTDYVDLTGEPEFVDRMYLAHHATAVRTGARIVHACGFDSVPHDLGALFTRRQLPDDVAVTIRGVVRSNAMVSGGTFHSALGQFARVRQMRRAMKERNEAEPRPEGRRARAKSDRPRRDRNLGLWLLPLPTIDPFIVQRSAAARADYGPDFTYTHYAGVKNPATIAVAAVGFTALMGAAQVPPLRRLLASRLPRGEGPSQQRRARSWFTVDFIGEADGRTVRTRVGGGDPGYTETAKMLGEAAMCLAYDDNPPTAGQVTTATAMGENLTRRLINAGITFSVLDPVTGKPGLSRR